MNLTADSEGPFHYPHSLAYRFSIFIIFGCFFIISHVWKFTLQCVKNGNYIKKVNPADCSGKILISFLNKYKSS